MTQISLLGLRFTVSAVGGVLSRDDDAQLFGVASAAPISSGAPGRRRAAGVDAALSLTEALAINVTASNGALESDVRLIGVELGGTRPAVALLSVNGVSVTLGNLTATLNGTLNEAIGVSGLFSQNARHVVLGVNGQASDDSYSVRALLFTWPGAELARLTTTTPSDATRTRHSFTEASSTVFSGAKPEMAVSEPFVGSAGFAALISVVVLCAVVIIAGIAYFVLKSKRENRTDAAPGV